jgi:hypothetical protein
MEIKTCYCIKTDVFGEVACDKAGYDLKTNHAVCTHECVVHLREELHKTERKLWNAESKLKQYREAIRPFIRNCRQVVEMADSMEEGEKKNEQ